VTAAANVTAMFQIGGTIGAVLVGWFMDKTRPAHVISVAYVGGAVFVLALGWMGALSSSLALLVFAAGFCMSGAQTGLNAYAPGRYPTVARATGVSWMLGMGRFGSIFGSAVGGALLGLGWQFGAILAMLAVPATLAAIAVQVTQRKQVEGPAVSANAAH
jgi:AAHS family 4-hydroxybenzoate transporter-like MFS transporter